MSHIETLYLFEALWQDILYVFTKQKLITMRKIILTTIFLSFMAVVAKAQYIGVKGGLNLSNLNIDGVDDENMRFGYHFGAFFNLPISDGFAVQPEVLYSTKGSTASINQDFGLFGEFNSEVKFKLNYIDIPLLAIFRVGDAFEIQAGPYIGFLAGSKVEADGDIDDEFDLDSDNFKNLDFGLTGGIALNFSAVQVGARYNYGLQEIQDSEGAELLIKDATNSYFQVFAALRLGNYD